MSKLAHEAGIDLMSLTLSLTQVFLSGLVLLGAAGSAAALDLQLPIQLPGQQQTNASNQPPGVTSAIEKIKLIQKEYDERLAKSDPWAVFEGYSGRSFADLRRETLQPFFPAVKDHPEYAGLKQKLYAQRQALARKGVNLDRWMMWDYDGQPVTDAHKKYFEAVEMNLNRISRSSTGGASASEAEALHKLDEILKRPEFSSDPVLSYYKQHFVSDQLAGARWIHNLKKVGYIGSELRDLRNRLKNMVKGSQTQLKAIKEQASRIIKLVDEVKAAGLKLTDFSVKLDERDPLSEEWNLEKTRAELVKVTQMK